MGKEDMEDPKFTVELEQIDGFEFKVKFGDDFELIMDEPDPIGTNKGPNASKVLSAAIANCLSASLFFCLQKARVEFGDVKTTVTTQLTRTENKRLRIGSSHVTINAKVDKTGGERLNKCIELFEDFCVVTASVREGIDVSVEVIDQDGEKLYDSAKN